MNQKLLTKVFAWLKSNPKKSAVLISFLVSLIGYRKRRAIMHFTFNQVLSRMNEKVMQQMSEQVSNVDRYNRKLSELQNITEEFYSTQRHKRVIFEILNDEIDSLRSKIKQLDKSSSTYQTERTALYIQLNQQLFAFSIGAILFTKLFEALIYLKDVVYIREKIYLFNVIDKDQVNVSKVIQKLFTCQQILGYIQFQICKQYFEQLKIALSSKQLDYKQQLSQKDFLALINFNVQPFNLGVSKELIDKGESHMVNIFNQLRDEIKTGDLLQKDSLLQGLTLGQEKCHEQINLLVELNECVSMRAFQHFSSQFNQFKMEVRYLVMEQRAEQRQAQPLMTHLTSLHKIIKEEFLSEQSDHINEQFYARKIKAALALGSEEQQGNDELSLIIIMKALEENEMNKILNGTVRQFSRKIMFKGEIADKEDESEGGVGMNGMGEIQKLLMNLTEN